MCTTEKKKADLRKTKIFITQDFVTEIGLMQQ